MYDKDKLLSEDVMNRESGLGFSTSEYAPRLLAWYAEHGRVLPWRVKGPHPDPYVVWVSEIMLQQTTVATVVPYFRQFMERFPNLVALAEASLDEVLMLWQGLGYYRRAHQLHACARVVWERYGGVFPRPETPGALRNLPGIGPYTAASIAALAFDMPEAVVDGNVARILSRLHCVGAPLDSVKNRLAEWAAELLPETDVADYTSAIMDLGAVVCRPRNPSCPMCPWREGCGAWGRGESDRYPVKLRRERPAYSGYVFWLEDEQGRVFVRRRTEGGLLKGLWEFPWVQAGDGLANTELEHTGSGAGVANAESGAGFGAGFANDESGTATIEWEDTGRSVRHTFTHFHLTLRILRGSVSRRCVGIDLDGSQGDGLFVAVSDFSLYPFSTLMRKVAREEGSRRREAGGEKQEG